MTGQSRARARIGVLVPFTNTNLEPDMMRLCPPGCTLHFARLGGYDIDAIPDSTQMAGLGASDLDEPLRLLAGVRPDVILYGCTSATLSHGPAFDRNLAAKVEALSGAKTVTAAGAVVMALTALGVRRIGFASPYVAELNDRAIAFLAESGIEAVSRADWPETLDNYGQGELTPDQIMDLARRADSRDAEVLVLSCTDMRSVEVVEQIEAALAKPVVASNQAMIFAALPLLGIETAEIQCGKLLSAVSIREKIV
ncbi:MAG: aspartate/glutamate racemase family protein [Paracoccaceae bacterium]|nr:aspartate/glutamate racemase family protein [Paracoccaceae bacterium]